MKKAILISVLILICFGIKAIAVNPEVCYVKTADKIYFGQNVIVRPLHTKIISLDGTIEKIHTSDIKAYMKDNKLFELMPIICEKGDTICYNFMEYLDSRSGLKLYRYKCFTGCTFEYAYFVFKDDKLYLRVNQMNAESVLPFFRVKYVKVC